MVSFGADCFFEGINNGCKFSMIWVGVGAFLWYGRQGGVKVPDVRHILYCICEMQVEMGYVWHER